MAHIHAPSDPTGRGADKFAELAAKYSNGEVEVKVFPSSQLGDLGKIFGASRSGAVDIALTPYPLLSDIVPAYNIYTAGYAFEGWDHLKTVINSPELGREWDSELLQKGGLRVLDSYYFGARTLTMTKDAVRKPEDLAGKKIRAVPNKLSLAVISGLGATPTPVALSELFQALSQGVVDGQENPIPTIYAQKLYDAQKYLILTRHQLIPIPWTVNERSWQRLGEANQKAVLRAAREAAEWITQEVLKEESGLLDQLAAKGMTVIGPEQGLDLAAFKASVGKQMQALEGELWPKGLAETVARLAPKS